MTEKTQPVDMEPVVERRPKKQDRTTLALLGIAAIVAVGGLGFAVGRASMPASTSGNGDNVGPFGGGRNMPSLAPGQTFNFGQMGGGLRDATGVSGTVESVDAGSITVKLADGTTVKVILSGTTTYHSQTAATAGDVLAGTTVKITLAVGAASSPPAAGSSAQPGVRTLTAGDVLITGP